MLLLNCHLLQSGAVAHYNVVLRRSVALGKRVNVRRAQPGGFVCRSKIPHYFPSHGISMSRPPSTTKVWPLTYVFFASMMTAIAMSVSREDE